MLPIEIINLISEYDYEIMCKLHLSNINLIYPRNCTYELAEYTAKHDYVDIFDYILTHNNTLSKNIAEIENLFETAVLSYSTDIVKYIFKQYNQDFYHDFVHFYILHTIHQKYTDIVYFLINQPSTNIEYNNGEILKASIENNDVSLTQYILNHPNTEDPSYYCDYNPLVHAIELGNSYIIDTILNHPKIDPHEPDNEPFYTAMDNGDGTTLEQLLQNDYVQETLDLDYEERRRLREIVWY